MSDMTRIGVRELRQHASRFLEQVKAGETVQVTERGRLVAVLVPPDPATSARDRLVAAGSLVPAATPLRLPARRTLPAVVPGTAGVLDAERAEG